MVCLSVHTQWITRWSVCPLVQIEDLSQQVHKAAAEKFKVPASSSPLAPPAPPSVALKEESEEEEEEEVGSPHWPPGVCA